jgi:LDH2 family malate/lactate/ureidoglycolate dehydrogenase
LHIESFVAADSFKDAIDEFIEDMKSCRTRPGFSEIKMPGERGYRAAEKNRDAGVEIPDFLWQDVMELVDELNVPL